jgi:hypothetical protein
MPTNPIFLFGWVKIIAEVSGVHPQGGWDGSVFL